MTASSRRKARDTRDRNRDQAKRRVQARPPITDSGTGIALPHVRPRDLQALRRGRPTLSKQSGKHMLARHEKTMARIRRELAEDLANVRERTTSAPVEVTSIRFFGSSCPMIGEGAVVVDGQQMAWRFRYRYDRAFLEVGSASDSGMVDVCLLHASRDDVTGNPYEGGLSRTAAVALLSELFNELTPPKRGVRFTERLDNTLELASGRGDPDAPHLIRTGE